MRGLRAAAWGTAVLGLMALGCGVDSVRPGHPVAITEERPGADAGHTEDGATPDPLPPDAGEADGGLADSGNTSGEIVDAGPADAGTLDAGIVFGGPGPWPTTNLLYGSANGILEMPVVGMTTDETQNRWAATHTALYLLEPGKTSFKRYAATDGLHLMGNPVSYCDSNFGGGDRSCPIFGAAAAPGISTIVGGGPNEVFVGYFGVDEGPGDWSDPERHSGKLDRVRVRPDGSLQVDRFDLVSNNHGAQYWHNRTIHRMVYDHFLHKHELYLGTNHGVDLLRPDAFRKPNPGEWFDTVNIEYMADHLHARVCYHAPCDNTESNQRMGDWRGLALSPDGMLWTAGKWTAGKIRWSADLKAWFSAGGSAFAVAFGDPYPTLDNGNGYINEPVFRVPLEGDEVNLSAVTVAPDGRVWFASDPAKPTEPAYGIASWDGRRFTVYDPIVLGLGEKNVRDLVALPDGRLVLAGPNTGLLIWNPATFAAQPLRGTAWLPDDHVNRLELDTMVSPPTLHVSTYSGAAALRALPAP